MREGETESSADGSALNSACHAAGPRLAAIFIAPAAGALMERREQIVAIAGKGLEGDRYASGRGYYSRRDGCEVTLIDAAALEEMRERFGVQVSNSEHRRNLVTCGLRLEELRGRRFRIGEVVLEYHKARPPCGYLERITQPRMTRAMGAGAGIAARIITGGTLHAGDTVELLPGRFAPLRRLP